MFDESQEAKLLDKEMAEMYHHTVAKLLWVYMWTRPENLSAISFLTSKVKAPDMDDWKKLKRVLAYLRQTINLPLRLKGNNINFDGLMPHM